MMIQHSLTRIVLYLFIYAFLGWAVEAALFSIRDRRFINRGFLNLPFNLPLGLSAAILMTTLPTLKHNQLLKYILCLLVYRIVHRFAEQFVRNRRHGMVYGDTERYSPIADGLLSMLIAGMLLTVHLLMHPFLSGLVMLMPPFFSRLLAISLCALTLMDYATVRYTLCTSGAARRRADTQRLGQRIAGGVWNRLQRAYPGIGEENPSAQRKYIFAKGMCLDKLAWVFLVSSFLGALIEMVYCRATGDIWMNRSSVLYGAFSFVWGFGAVVLTVTLQRLAGRADRFIFLAGFFIGGAYEYLCSVFTEIVFGTVFWDYSHMPLNIGGRTNVLYCIFWGLLAVVWVKILYPPMERGIEKIPPVAGKVLTWMILLAMAFNGLLTAGAMIRYTQRQSAPQSIGMVTAFFDTHYDDAYMEHRWPNMKPAEPQALSD